MNKADVQVCLNSLSARKCIFHSEAEFQFELAWEIKNKLSDKYKKMEVRFEFPAQKLRNNSSLLKGMGDSRSRPAIDLLVIINDRWYPIELKYITAKLSDDEYNLVDGNGTDKAFNFIYDIKRIELFADAYKDNFDKGFSILLTNNQSYYNSKKINTNTFNYDSFYLTDNRIIGGTVWYKSEAKIRHETPQKANQNVKLRKIDEKKYFNLRAAYPIKWEYYSSVHGQGINSKFKYVICEVTV